MFLLNCSDFDLAFLLESEWFSLSIFAEKKTMLCCFVSLQKVAFVIGHNIAQIL